MSRQPIARRRFTIGAAGPDTLDLLIYAPVEDRGDYRCDYEIRENGRLVREFHMLGADSLQALILSIQAAGADITFSDHGRLRQLFLDGQNADLGLPLLKGVQS